MVLVALLSNPGSTGNRAVLPRIRDFCAGRADIFHYELENVGDVGAAFETIARVKPRLLVINGGDGTVQMALTELFHGGQFGAKLPPVAVLPNGKTNLIALDLGVKGDPITALERMLEIARGDVAPHLVERELIALTEGDKGSNRPVLGMFLGGAGLADTILYCRDKIYPLGLPNGLSHVVAGIAVFFSLFFGVRGKHLPPPPAPVRVSLLKQDGETRRFSFLIVTTLEKLLFSSHTASEAQHPMGLRLLAVEQSARSLFKALWRSMRGTLTTDVAAGVHVEQGDEIRIESDRTSVILDGETFSAIAGRPIVLRATAPMAFLRLAA